MSEERDRAILMVLQALYAREQQMRGAARIIYVLQAREHQLRDAEDPLHDLRVFYQEWRAAAADPDCAALSTTVQKGAVNLPTPYGAPSGATTVKSTPAPLVHARAPTLIGGLTPGARGEVRVWAPQRRLVMQSLGNAVSTMTAAAVAMWFAAVHNLGYLVAWFLPKASMGMIAAALTSLRRPCVVTTDEGGIAVTTWRGSRALRWEEIVAAVGTDHQFYLYTLPGERIAIGAVGHRKDTREALTSLILRRADLQKTPQHWWAPGRQRRYFLRKHFIAVRGDNRWRPAFLWAGRYRESLPPG